MTIHIIVISGDNANMKGGLGGDSGSMCCGYGADGMIYTFGNFYLSII